MKAYFMVWILLQLHNVVTRVYYSNQIRKTYGEADEFCNRIEGRLLRYGGLFNEVVRTCGENVVEVWTGTPWYILQKGCVVLDEPEEKTLQIPINKSTSGVAVCADHCSQENFTQFAVQISECQCYTDMTEDVTYLNRYWSKTCRSGKCIGNKFDVCGMRHTVHTVYRKEISLPKNRCPVRKYANETSDGDEILIECSAENLTFICQVGETDDILCNFDELSDTTGMSTEIRTGGLFSSDMTGARFRNDSLISGFIILGVIVGMLIVAMVVIVCVLVRMRRELLSLKTERDKNHEIPEMNSSPLYTALDANDRGDTHYEM